MQWIRACLDMVFGRAVALFAGDPELAHARVHHLCIGMLTGLAAGAVALDTVQVPESGSARRRAGRG